jgi:CRISPR-associated protein Cmr4
MMKGKKSAILGLHAQTSIHAGSGRQTGFVDLPIQREGHNGWPCIFGSGVKGALRSNAEEKKFNLLLEENVPVDSPDDYDEKVRNAEDISAIYGPTTTRASEHAGALIVSDARLLLLPVRSLTSQFKWVTCPYAIQRFQQDRRRLYVDGNGYTFPDVVDTASHARAVVHPEAPDGDLFLEEYRFRTDKQDLDESLVAALVNLMGRDDALPALKRQLVIVSNDSFAHLVNHATPVNAHIAIEAQTKTVKDGALWYEETLPPETLLYTGLVANDARNGNGAMTAVTILDSVLTQFKDDPWLRIGGNETVGMGWCSVKPCPQEV